jgi:hypothetical protein
MKSDTMHIYYPQEAQVALKRTAKLTEESMSALIRRLVEKEHKRILKKAEAEKDC